MTSSPASISPDATEHGTAQTPDVSRTAGPAPGALPLAVLGLGWLAAMLWSAWTAVSAAPGETMAATAAAYALPGVISAGLVGGAAVGLVVANVCTRRAILRSTPRFALTVGVGLAVGLASALTVTLADGGGPAGMVLAGTTAAAATVGGALAGVRRTQVVAAVVAGALAVFAVGFALSLFQDSVLNLYGAGETQASQVNALNWFSRTASVGSGLAAGLLAFGYLRMAARRSQAAASPGSAPAPVAPTGTDPRWPTYLVAGLGAGLLLLAAEVLTRTAGAQVVALAGSLSEADQAAQGLLAGARITHSLIVLFAGGFVALVAFGRTLRPAEDQGEGRAEDPDEGPAERRGAARA